MSAELNVSRITILGAYAQLRAEGYFETRKGAGTFVSGSLPEHLTQVQTASGGSERKKLPGRVRSRAGRCCTRTDQRDPGIAGLGAFAVHQPAFDEFPFAIWSRLVTHHSKNPNARAIHCIDPMGSQALSRSDLRLSAHGARSAGRAGTDHDRLRLAAGAADCRQRTARSRRTPVWMEEPGYRLARNVFLAAGCRPVPVPVDEEGLNVTAGIKRCAHARAAYVTPSHQYPLGSTMSAARRLQLLNWAQQHGAWIIEDDYDSEYRFESAPISSLQGLDTNSRVIYIGTFSKVLFASLRLGYMVIPPDLVERFVAVRYVMDIFPPYLYQEVIADFMREGHFARHIRRMRLLYSGRRKVLVEQLRKVFGDTFEIHGAEAGMHLTAAFHGDRDDVAIATRAAAQGLWLWPLSANYATRHDRKGFILGYGNVGLQAIPAAVEKLRVAMARE